MVYYCQDSLWIKIYIAADDFWWLLFFCCVPWRQPWWKFTDRAPKFWSNHSAKLLSEILNFISFQGLLQRVLRSHLQCSHALKALCSGCQRFYNLRGKMIWPGYQTLLRFVAAAAWPAGRCLCCHRWPQWWSVAPDGHLLWTRHPWKARLAVLLSAKRARSAVGLQCLLSMVAGCTHLPVGSLVSVPSTAFEGQAEMKCERLKWQCSVFLTPKYFRVLIY